LEQKPFILEIKNLRPNNWYLCKEKVNKVRLSEKKLRSKPIQVLQIDQDWALIDGHSRAYVAWEEKIEWIECQILNANDCNPVELRLYQWIHRNSKRFGITLISDLKDRILPERDYETQWLGFCKTKLQEFSKNYGN